MARRRQGRDDLALALADQATRADPGLAAAWLAAGELQLASGRPGNAAVSLERAAALAPHDPVILAGLAAARHAAGDAAAAEQAFRAALALDPDAHDCRSNLGLLLLELERADEAVALFTAGLRRQGDHVGLRRNLGDALAQAGRFRDAAAAYAAALALDPDDAAAHNNLGGALQALGDFAGARASYRRALAIREDAAVWANLSAACLGAGDAAGAVQAAQRALALAPDDAVALSRLGGAFSAAGDARAEAVLRRAHALDPANLDAAYGLALHLSREFQSEAALGVLERTLAGTKRGPALENALRLRATLQRTLGRQDASRSGFAALLTTGRVSVATRFCATLAAIPLIYRDAAEIDATRERYRQGLLELAAAQRADPAAFAAEAATFVGMLQPYYLAYQGRCDRKLQTLYGDILHAAQRQAFPELAAPLGPRPPSRDTRLTLGIVSGYFHQHSNWKLNIRGWLANIDRRRFRCVCYFTGRSEDANTREARQLADAFTGSGGSWRKLAEKIRADRPDILLYPEIGMHPDTLRLALLRLAPVQCVSWGHPDTSGLPSMDYYLSSAAMEPGDAADHYSERLVRLPGLGSVYSPLCLPTSGAQREDFGLDRDDAVFLCAQSLPKYLPQHDSLLAAIAGEVPQSRFVFIESWIARGIAQVLRERLTRAFAAQGLDAARHIVFLPHMSTPRFHDLCHAADVALDTPDWSGCNSSLEALEHDLPVLTLPGGLMRGRHTLAFLSLMECEELVAGDAGDYVQKAVALARDKTLRAAAAGRIARNKNRLYDDLRPMRALEDAFEDMAARAGARA